VGPASNIGLRKWIDPVLFNTGHMVMVPNVTYRRRNGMNCVSCLSSPKILECVVDVRKDYVQPRTSHEGPDWE